MILIMSDMKGELAVMTQSCPNRRYTSERKVRFFPRVRRPKSTIMDVWKAAVLECKRTGPIFRGNIEIPHSRKTKTCSETLVTSL